MMLKLYLHPCSFRAAYVACMTLLLMALTSVAPVMAMPDEEDGLTSADKESLSRARDPEQKLKIYIDIAGHRMKELIQLAAKQDKENTPIAVKGYQTAVTGAEECVVGAKEDSKTSRKMVGTFYRVLQNYNATLVRAMEKTTDEFRPQIEAAFNVSTGIQQGMSVRAERYGIK